MKVTHYKILGLRDGASSKEVKFAFRKLAKIYHPDKNKGRQSEQKFKKIVSAYQVLNDSLSKRIYDRSLGIVEVIDNDTQHQVKNTVKAENNYRNVNKNSLETSKGYHIGFIVILYIILLLILNAMR
jgi:DnaJ-class molecular chaperone